MTWHRNILSALPMRALLLLALQGSLSFAGMPFQPVYRDPLLEPWRWRTFPELSGLNAQCIGEGPNGSLWFGSVDGLWSYDGIDWINCTNNGGAGAVSICSAADTLYVAGHRDIRRLRDGHWSRMLLTERSCLIRKLSVSPDGSLWAATSWGLLHSSGGQWTLFTDPEIAGQRRTEHTNYLVNAVVLPAAILGKARTGHLPVRRHDFEDVCADRNGRIWAGTSGGEILCFDPAATNPPAPRSPWTLYNETDGLVCGRNPSILPLQDGTVWVVYEETSGYLNRFDGTAWQASPLADAGAPPDGGNLIQTRDGTVWLSARYQLAAFRDGRWQIYQKPALPIPEAHNFILESSDGALWFGGPNTEIERVDYASARWATLPDLNFGWESPAGAQWFLHRNGRVVVRDENGRWISYGAEDGVIDTPVALLGTQAGEVWVAGSHEHTAATARFDGHQWTRHVHRDFSWGVERRSAFEASDGSLWLGATVDSSGPPEHGQGLLQFHHGQWIHHHQPGRGPDGLADTNPAVLLPATQKPEPIGKFYCVGESRDGKIWAGRSILAANDGRKWAVFRAPSGIHFGNIEILFTSREGDLWIGTQQFGAVRYDGHEWGQYQGKDSLVANSVRSLTQMPDGSIWAATDRGASRFDGRTWTANLLPPALTLPEDGGDFKASPSGTLWINRFTREWLLRGWPKAPRPDTTNSEFWTVSHRFQGKPPRTTITTGAKLVSPPGNISILWGGEAAWQEPHDSPLQFSYRLDNQPWAAYTFAGGHSFFTLPTGRHHFEVRARDRDFNVDPRPATLDFVVLPPVWHQAWFLLLMAIVAGLLLALFIRVLWDRARLRKAHDELELRVQQRTAQLEAANSELESFSYSVSHDLRAPLRAVDGFGQILLEDYQDRLDAEGMDSLRRMCAASQRMGKLIDDLLELSRRSRGEMHLAQVNLSAMVQALAEELRRTAPDRQAEFVIAPDVVVRADAPLMQVALENLLNNAWKFTGKKPAARIEFGRMTHGNETVYFVRDNGAGFDMKYAQRLFGAFQRLHSADEFPGTGIGLATVQRIIRRHGGRIWAESRTGEETTFYFTMASG